MTPFKIQWQAPEFSYREKSVSWYWLTIVAAVLIIGFAVWQRNFLFGFFVLVAEILILVWANQRPREVNFLLDEQGFEIDALKHYAYAEIESWSIDADFDPDWPDFYFRFKSKIRPTLKIKVPEARSAEIQKALKAIIPQTEHERTLLEAIERIIGF